LKIKGRKRKSILGHNGKGMCAFLTMERIGNGERIKRGIERGRLEGKIYEGGDGGRNSGKG
jgi:hypothetical protein